MKYFKCEDGQFGCQRKVPSYGTEITYEEYLELQSAFEVRQAKIADYVQKIRDEVITLNDVPAEYYDEVYAIINTPQPYDPDQEFVDRLISEVIG